MTSHHFSTIQTLTNILEFYKANGVMINAVAEAHQRKTLKYIWGTS